MQIEQLTHPLERCRPAAPFAAQLRSAALAEIAALAELAEAIPRLFVATVEAVETLEIVVPGYFELIRVLIFQRQR